MTNQQFRILYGFLQVIMLFLIGDIETAKRAHKTVREEYTKWDKANE